MGNMGAPGGVPSQPGGRGAFVAYAVPSKKAGPVIGKGGESIKEINRRSGAHVEIQRNDMMGAAPSDPGSQRIFHISGQPLQIEEAITMIHEQ